MEVTNPKKSFEQKQGDKFELKLRFGKLTIITLEYDHSNKKLEWNILSLLIGNHIFGKKEA